MSKVYNNLTVLEASKQRIAFLFDEFEHIYCSVSGGKDSTVLFYLVYEEAKKRNRLPLDVLFIDWEAQYQHTIDNITTIFSNPGINPIWICLPLSTDNGSSWFEPTWTCWEPGKRNKWVRSFPDHPGVITDYQYFDFYRYAMSFEDFVKGFADWYATKQNADKVATLLGVRASESFHRHLHIKARKNKIKYKGHQWLNKMKAQTQNVYNAYVIYDWEIPDVWKFIGINQLPYNRVYDLMYQHGRSINDMRVCEPFGYEARAGIQYYQEIEPETWARMVDRVDGLNTGSIYGKESLYGYQNKLPKPDNMTWKEYSYTLLNSMPEPVRSHYERRINVFVKWFQKNLHWDDLKEEDDIKKELAKKGGSWRMIARTLIKNDLFCEGLSFQVNKNEFEKIARLKDKYLDL